MTWVIAERGAIHAFIAGDLRVTWPSGAYHDCLQKVHAVAPYVLLGFAGSVVLGLEVVEKARGQWKTHIHTIRSIYSRYPRLFKALREKHLHDRRDAGEIDPKDGTAFLMLSRKQHAPQYRIHVFEPPDYRARVIGWQEQGAIGSGNDHAALVESFRFLRDPSLEFRFANRPQTFGGIVAAQLFQFLSEQPISTVSKWFVYGTFMNNGRQFIESHVDVQLIRNRGDAVATGSTTRPPPLITDLAAYRAFAAQHGLQAEAAIG